MPEELNQNDELIEGENGADNRIWIIVAIVLIVLCCCCLFAGIGGTWLWNNGDELFGLTKQLIFVI
ncbi:MAG: hypothetical protein U9Q82_09335 [Chloroflexota bacterium]|nr:hypothetical protein [Chloroflexota bacterium]